MSIEETLNQIKTLITSDKLEAAIEKILNEISSIPIESQKTLYLLNADLTALNLARRRRTLTSEAYRARRNAINLAIIEVIEEITGKYESE
ncbi:MAG: hypothetical protein AAF570_22805 [Bacteroidota bacterium]